MKLSDIVREADEDLGLNFDRGDNKGATPPEEKQKVKKAPEDKAGGGDKGKAPNPADDNDEHKHPDTFEDQLKELFSKADSDGSLQPYQQSQTIQVRPANPNEEIHIKFPGELTKSVTAKKGEFVIRDPEDPSLMKVMSKLELDRDFEPEGQTQQPDAEGYVTYNPKGEVMAFQYQENEPLKLKDDNGRRITIKHGDYLGYPAIDASELIRMDQQHFEKKYQLAK